MEGEALLRQRLEACRGRAALVELRLDHVDAAAPDLLARLQNLRTDFPEFAFVGACRFASSRAEQVRLLEAAGEAGFDYVDQPLEIESALKLPARVRRIHSWHQEGPGLCDLSAKLEALRERASENDLCKVVAWAEHAEDAWPCLDLYEGDPQKLLAFAQGPGGSASRLLALRAGAPWIYCSWPGEATAPGQWSLPEVETALPSDFRAQTPVLGVVGEPVEHSLSPYLWHQVGVLEPQAPELVYLKFPVADLSRFLQGAAHHGVRALSITAPHKQQAFQHASTASAVATTCQAANLLVLEQGLAGQRIPSWAAAHTDGDGAMDALLAQGLLPGATILLLGAGGAAQAVAAEAKLRGHAVTLSSRRRPQTQASDISWVAWQEADPSTFDVVIQATPIGSLPQPGNPSAGRPPRAGALALDMVYHPPITAWMREAQAAGADVLPGTAMLVHQMVAQYRLVFPQHPAPNADALLQALAMHLQQRASILLVGARASGKSTLGQHLAQTLGRTFLDADLLLAERHGRNLADWITTDEANFRQAEANLLVELLATPDAVIATGGGVVSQPESVRLLKEAPRVVYLDCPEDVLLQRQTEAPRPRLRAGTLAEEIATLMRERESSYRAMADLVISPNEEPVSGVMEILRGFGLKGIVKGFR